MKRPIPMRTKLAMKEIGENLQTWRKLRHITSAELADAAGVARATISKLENGDPSVSFATVINVCNAIAITDRLILATDPLDTDYGRARAGQLLPQRVRGE